MKRKVLVFTPHADDSELGMGGTIAKHILDGDYVRTVLIADHKDPVRIDQFYEACSILRSMPVLACMEGWSFQDQHIGEDMSKLVGFMDYVKNKFQPDLVYLPFPSVHQDHCAVYEAGVRMARLSLNEKEWFIPSVLVYREPVSQMDIYSPNLQFSLFNELPPEAVKRKLEAIKAHKTEILEYPHPSSPEYLDYEARAEGGKCGVEHAEVFAALRVRL